MPLSNVPAAGMTRRIATSSLTGSTSFGTSHEFELAATQRLKLFRMCGVLLSKPDLFFLNQVLRKRAACAKRNAIESFQESRDNWETFQAALAYTRSVAKGRIVRVDNTRNPRVVEA